MKLDLKAAEAVMSSRGSGGDPASRKDYAEAVRALTEHFGRPPSARMLAAAMNWSKAKVDYQRAASKAAAQAAAMKARAQ